MVDIDSESGAVIAAAAAAGAAIEAARRRAEEAARRAPPPRADAAARSRAMRGPRARDPSRGAIRHDRDPTTTVRLSRERILQALADDDSGIASVRRPSRRASARCDQPGELA